MLLPTHPSLLPAKIETRCRRHTTVDATSPFLRATLDKDKPHRVTSMSSSLFDQNFRLASTESKLVLKATLKTARYLMTPSNLCRSYLYGFPIWNSRAGWNIKTQGRRKSRSENYEVVENCKASMCTGPLLATKSALASGHCADHRHVWTSVPAPTRLLQCKASATAMDFSPRVGRARKKTHID